VSGGFFKLSVNGKSLKEEGYEEAGDNGFGFDVRLGLFAGCDAAERAGCRLLA